MAQRGLTVCTWPGCGRGGPIRRGYCDLHYLRWRRHGDPSKGHRSPGEAHAFVEAAAASTTDDCILWPYPLLNSGYGQLAVNGKRWSAHRLTLAMASGGDREGMHAAHGECHNRACINPRHLYWATPARNAADKARDGTAQRGERASRAKLTESDVRSIRELLAAGVPQKEIGERWGLGQSAVSSIATRGTWGWLADPGPPPLRGRGKRIGPSIPKLMLMVLDADPSKVWSYPDLVEALGSLGRAITDVAVLRNAAMTLERRGEVRRVSGGVSRRPPQDRLTLPASMLGR